MKLGSMCSGAGMLDVGVARVLDVTHAWFAELDPAASQVLAAHWPEVPNLGDVRAIDWSAVEPVDILCAGFPCQPVSAAGKRKGIDDERWLFDDIAEAVGRMESQPRMLVLENVPGLLTANRGHAMARVVRGLASLGYVGRYRVLRASDIGAAHRRERWFCVATLADADSGRLGAPVGDLLPGEPNSAGRGAAAGLSLLPTPTARDGDGRGEGGPDYWQRRREEVGRDNGIPLGAAVTLLPTPTATPYGNNQSPSAGAAIRPSLNSLAANALLPTPTAMHDARNATSGRTNPKASTNTNGWTLADIAYADRWGEYAPAIARWEQVTGRPAPDPTEPGTKGQPRLSPRFVEWLMGWPDCWVTGLLRRNDALRVLGNGVVPHQAAAALSSLLITEGVAA